MKKNSFQPLKPLITPTNNGIMLPLKIVPRKSIPALLFLTLCTSHRLLKCAHWILPYRMFLDSFYIFPNHPSLNTKVNSVTLGDIFFLLSLPRLQDFLCKFFFHSTISSIFFPQQLIFCISASLGKCLSSLSYYHRH